MGIGRLDLHVAVLVAAVVMGMWSIWEEGLIPEEKNYSNFLALAMVLLVVGQITGIKACESQKKKEH